MGSTSDDVEIEKEVKHFNFRHLCKAKVGPPVDNANHCYNHLAVSNKHGLIFAVSGNDIKVVSIATLEKISLTEITVNDAVTSFPHQKLSVGFPIDRIHLTCDEANIIIAYKNSQGAHIGAISTSILSAQDQSNAVYTTSTLNTSPGVFVKDIKCHPELPSTLAVCLSVGHVLMVDLTATEGFKVFGSLTQQPAACSICWSPKGKQIVIGFVDGKLIQYDKLLKTQKKVTNPPNIFEEGEQKQVGGLFWISSFLFMAVYNSPDLTQSPVFVMVSTQKEGPPSYSVLDDIYFGFNEERLLCYYFSYVPSWQLMVTIASNAMEAVPVGLLGDTWYRWDLGDSARAEVPLCAADNNDAFGVGAGICLNSTIPIKQDDRDLPPAPVFAMLTTDGVLCTFQMVNQDPSALVVTQQGLLTAAVPVPNEPPKRGVSLSTPGAPVAPTPAAQPPPAVKPLTFNFSGTSSASPLQPSPNFGLKFGAPSTTGPVFGAQPTTGPVFSLGNAQKPAGASAPSFTFGSNNNRPPSSNVPPPAVTPVAPSKPLFALGSPAQQPSFAFNLASNLGTKPPAESSSFTPVVKPFETPKPAFQPVPQQQPAPVKPQVLPPGTDKVGLFSPVPGSVGGGVQPSGPLNSTSLITPPKPLPVQTIQPTPVSTLKSPVKSDNNNVVEEVEIAEDVEKLNITLQKNIMEEVSNFTAEIEALKESCAGLSCDELIGSRSELINMKSDISELVTRMDGYKEVMRENKSEGTLLRENVLKNLQMLDEGRLLKEKMEDKRYSNAMKARPLDPISARQRKAVRAHASQVEQLLNDINAALDSKWEERMAARKKARNKQSGIAQRQQLYQTIDAIDQITNNLSSRINKLSLQSQDMSLLSMNVTRNTILSNTTAAGGTRISPGKSPGAKVATVNSPLKLKQLKTYLNNRGQTPVRKVKNYSSLVLPRDPNSSLNPSFSQFPKAASTPAAHLQDTDSTKKILFSQQQPVIDENSTLSDTLSKIDKEYMTPTVLNKAPITLAAGLRVPDNTPVTPDIVMEKTQPVKHLAESDLVNKNLFGTPLSVGKPAPLHLQDEKPAFQVRAASPLVAKPSEAMPNPFLDTSVDPKSFWGNSEPAPTKVAEPENTEIEAPTDSAGESPSEEEIPYSVDTVDEIEPQFSSEGEPETKPEPSVKEAIESIEPAEAEVAVEEKTAPEPATIAAPKFTFGDATPTPQSGTLFSNIPKEKPPEKVKDVAAAPPLGAPKPFTFNFGPPGLSTKSPQELSSSPAGILGGNVFGGSAAPAFGGTPAFNLGAPGFSLNPKSSSEAVSAPVFGASSAVKAAPTFADLAAVPPEEPTKSEIDIPAETSEVVTSSTDSAQAAEVETENDSHPSTTTTEPVAASEDAEASSEVTTSLPASEVVPPASEVVPPASEVFPPASEVVPSKSEVFPSTVVPANVNPFLESSAGPTEITGVPSSPLNTAITTPAPVGLFGAPKTSTSSPFAGLFGGPSTNTSTGLFGTAPANAASTASSGLFGTPKATGMFGTLVAATTTASTGLFGTGKPTTAAGGGLFGGTTTTTSAGGGLFGGTTTTTSAGGGLFGGTTTTTSAGGGLFGTAAPVTSTTGLFGTTTAASTSSGSLFGAATTSAPATADSQIKGFFKTPASSSSGGLFGSSASGGGLFGASGAPTLFGNTPASTSGNIFLSGGTTTSTSAPPAFGSSAFGSTTQSGTSGGGGGGFGGFGLGGGPQNDPNKNPFGSVPTTPGNTSTPSLFGSSTSAGFGQTATAPSQIGSGSFSKGFGSGLASGLGQASPTPAAPAFGGAPTFGSPPAFGAAPAFGGAPAFGASPPSAFGGGSAFGSGSTFGSGSVFGGGGSSLPSFGSLASQTDNTPTFGSAAAQAAPTFGSAAAQAAPTFGSAAAQAAPMFGSAAGQAAPAFGSAAVQAAPTFGGFGSTPAPAPAAPSGTQFSSWR